VTPPITINPAMTKVSYDPIKDFAPISAVAVNGFVLVVNKDFPPKSVAEFISWCKANPGKVNMASSGSGTSVHLSGELFKTMTGCQMLHVPYKGAGPGISDLVSGHVPFMTPNVTAQLLDLHRTGKVRILAVLAPTRLKGAPDIPTAAEQGMPALNAQLFNALFAPAATPKPIVDEVAQATHAALSDPAFQEALIKAGFEPVIDSSPEKAKAFVDSEHQRLIPVIKAAGLKVG
jgi:tripartite-type tricarboxylate transporter receptor subunit TctC